MRTGATVLAFAVVMGAILSRFRKSRQEGRRPTAASTADSGSFAYDTSVDLHLRAALEAAKHRRSLSMEASLGSPYGGKPTPSRFTYDGGRSRDGSSSICMDVGGGGRSCRASTGDMGGRTSHDRHWYIQRERRATVGGIGAAAADEVGGRGRVQRSWMYAASGSAHPGPPYQQDWKKRLQFVQQSQMFAMTERSTEHDARQNAAAQCAPSRASLDCRRTALPGRRGVSEDVRAPCAAPQRSAARRSVDALREPLDWARSALLGRRRAAPRHKLVAVPAEDRRGADAAPSGAPAAVPHACQAVAQSAATAPVASSDFSARVSPVRNLMMESCSSSDEMLAMRDVGPSEVRSAVLCAIGMPSLGRGGADHDGARKTLWLGLTTTHGVPEDTDLLSIIRPRCLNVVAYASIARRLRPHRLCHATLLWPQGHGKHAMGLTHSRRKHDTRNG